MVVGVRKIERGDVFCHDNHNDFNCCHAKTDIHSCSPSKLKVLKYISGVRKKVTSMEL